METTNTYKELLQKIEHLEGQLSEAQHTIDAIREGEVDAFIVNNGNGHQIYTLKTADLTYRIFIEKMAEGAITLNKKGIVLYANSSFAEMLELPLAAILGCRFESLFPKDQRAKVSKLIATAWHRECKEETELRNISDKVHPVLLSMNSLGMDGEETLSIIITDLSFQKESMEQKRTIEKKDEFITIASHELRTPVTSIKGYIQVLKYTFMAEGNDNAVQLLARADMQINKLATLINDLLDVKKIENGKLTYNAASFDFNELVTETLEETERVIKNHRLRCRLSPPCSVLGDRNKIGQVITNFIDNAAKYSPHGTTIEIITTLEKNSVRLSVKDSGMGIPKDQQEKVFERFFRVSGDKDNTYSGLGLGLYISSEIIKRHDGIIGVESEFNKGSCFYFELPLYKELSL